MRISMLTGKKWYHRRKLLTPAFHFNILKKFTRTFNDQTAEMIESFQEEIEKDRTEIMPLIMKHTLRVMCGKITLRSLICATVCTKQVALLVSNYQKEMVKKFKMFKLHLIYGV